MSRKAIVQAAPLHIQVMQGFGFKSRPDQTVHTLTTTAGKAEVCVGKSKVRLNFAKPLTDGNGKPLHGSKSPKASAALKSAAGLLTGRSNSWTGGGMVITSDADVTAGRLLIAHATGVVAAKPEAAPRVKRPKAEPSAADLAADAAAQRAAADEARQRIGDAGKVAA